MQCLLIALQEKVDPISFYFMSPWEKSHCCCAAYTLKKSPGWENISQFYFQIHHAQCWISVLQLFWLLNISLDSSAGCNTNTTSSFDIPTESVGGFKPNRIYPAFIDHCLVSWPCGYSSVLLVETLMSISSAKMLLLEHWFLERGEFIKSLDILVLSTGQMSELPLVAVVTASGGGCHPGYGW